MIMRDWSTGSVNAWSPLWEHYKGLEPYWFYLPMDTCWLTPCFAQLTDWKFCKRTLWRKALERGWVQQYLWTNKQHHENSTFRRPPLWRLECLSRPTLKTVIWRGFRVRVENTLWLCKWETYVWSILSGYLAVLGFLICCCYLSLILWVVLTACACNKSLLLMLFVLALATVSILNDTCFPCFCSFVWFLLCVFLIVLF